MLKYLVVALMLLTPAALFAQHRGGYGGSYRGGGHGYSGGGRSYGYSSPGRSYYRGGGAPRVYVAPRYYGGGYGYRRPYYRGGIFLGYFGMPFGYSYRPGYCTPNGYYDRWGYWHRLPGCYVDPYYDPYYPY